MATLHCCSVLTCLCTHTRPWAQLTDVEQASDQPTVDLAKKHIALSQLLSKIVNSNKSNWAQGNSASKKCETTQQHVRCVCSCHLISEMKSYKTTSAVTAATAAAAKSKEETNKRNPKEAKKSCWKWNKRTKTCSLRGPRAAIRLKDANEAKTFAQFRLSRAVYRIPPPIETTRRADVADRPTDRPDEEWNYGWIFYCWRGHSQKKNFLSDKKNLPDREMR